MLFANVFVPPVPESVIDEGGAWAPTAPLMATEPVAPGVTVKALAAVLVELIELLKVMAEPVAVLVKVVSILRMMGAPKF